jgi:hypothetical protein
VIVTGEPDELVELDEPPAPVTASCVVPLPLPVTVRFSLVGQLIVVYAVAGSPMPTGAVVVALATVVVVVVVVVVARSTGLRRRG